MRRLSRGTSRGEGPESGVKLSDEVAGAREGPSSGDRAGFMTGGEAAAGTGAVSGCGCDLGDAEGCGAGAVSEEV